MNHILTLLKSLLKTDNQSADDAYLAESADICELENRMRTLDRRDRNAPYFPIVSHG